LLEDLTDATAAYAAAAVLEDLTDATAAYAAAAVLEDLTDATAAYAAAAARSRGIGSVRWFRQTGPEFWYKRHHPV
jgi:hypothetical protein